MKVLTLAQAIKLKFKSLAHKEIRRIQSGHSNFDQIQITSELKTLLRRCYDYECQGLKYRTEDALKIRSARSISTSSTSQSINFCISPVSFFNKFQVVILNVFIPE